MNDYVSNPIANVGKELLVCGANPNALGQNCETLYFLEPSVPANKTVTYALYVHRVGDGGIATVLLT